MNTDGSEDGPDDLRISEMGPDGSATYAAFPPRVAYNSVSNEYLVAWTADDDTPPLVDNDYEVFGQRLAADGSQVGANDFRISDMGPVGASGFEPFRPDISYNPNANEYVLTWHGDDNTPPLVDGELEIFGQRLAANGAEIGSNDFRVSQLGPDGNQVFDNLRPAVAYNSRTCDYVAAWSANPNVGGLADNEFEIWGRRIGAPACVSPPTPPVPTPPETGPNPGRCANPKTGTDASETLNGTAFGDLISGLGGDDVINGLQGDDCLNGGPGRDRLSGAAGRDRLFGGRGRDRLSGAAGRDRLSGGAANDRLSAGDGRDRLFGGPGDDMIRPGVGHDRVRAGTGNDRVVTRGAVRDRIDCGPGRDVAIVDRLDRTRRCEDVRGP